ncbi:MAG: demethoxyubiquinone hydroxylase family protein [Chromatiales bacterium]|jgi:ubiquinone biosynthesis monooxygenase Coq7
MSIQTRATQSAEAASNREPAARPAETLSRLPPDMIPALRSDHAGETGAVLIYAGILALSRDPEVLEFARHHLDTEQRHLELMERVVMPEHRSRLLPVWRLAGWLTGALPALFGARAVYRTIEAVESFVDGHYAEQIEVLRGRPEHRELYEILVSCRSDELAHRDDARGRLGQPGAIGRTWTALVDIGSRAGVFLAGRF